MARVRVLVAAVLAAAALSVLAGPAAASAPAANPAKFCKAISGISDQIDSSSPSNVSGAKKQFQTIASKLKSAAKNAPSAVKNATNKLASFYSALGSGNASALAKLGSSSYTKSVETFSSYIADNCD